LGNCCVDVNKEETVDLEVVFTGLLVMNDGNGVAVTNIDDCAFPFQLGNEMERHSRVQRRRKGKPKCLAPSFLVVVVSFLFDEYPVYCAVFGRRLLSHLRVCLVA